MATTYVQAVNEVLQRIREDQVVSVADSDYSKLIGKFVNEAKREVEDAHNWSHLKSSGTLSTTALVAGPYPISTNPRSKIIAAYNQSNGWPINPMTQDDYDRMMNMLSGAPASPTNYLVASTDPTAPLSIMLFPTPLASGINLFLRLKLAQDDLYNDTDVIRVPPHLVVLGAVAKALDDRGDPEEVVQRRLRAYEEAVDTAISVDAETDPGQTDWEPI